jgi:hypothetical protein
VLVAGMVAAMTLSSFALFTPGASASSSVVNGTVHCNAGDVACGANPVLTGPPPPFVTIPTNCPSFLSTDAWSLDFTSGNTVFHGTENKNGDWGGFTAEGWAVLTDSHGTVEFAGHLTEWGGGGNNSGGQTAGGFTLTFNGSGIAGSLSIRVTGHTTTNNAGTPTSNFQNVTVTCS